MPDLSAPTRFDKLCRCASQLGISGQTIASKLGVSVMTLNRWRRGSHEPRTHDMERMITRVKDMINTHIDEACATVEDC